MAEVTFNACMVGLRKLDGRLMQKSWKLVTTIPQVVDQFKYLRCDPAYGHIHGKCEGVDTRRSGRYTLQMANLVHLCVLRRLRQIWRLNTKQKARSVPYSMLLNADNNSDKLETSRCESVAAKENADPNVLVDSGKGDFQKRKTKRKKTMQKAV